MALRHYILHDKKNKLIVYEEMIDGKSFIFVSQSGETTQIPIKSWRKIMQAWETNGWSDKWDMLDGCVAPIEM